MTSSPHSAPKGWRRYTEAIFALDVRTGRQAWRHTIEMRANPHAETEIRALFLNIYLCLSALDPYLFGDYEIVEEDKK